MTGEVRLVHLKHLQVFEQQMRMQACESMMSVAGEVLLFNRQCATSAVCVRRTVWNHGIILAVAQRTQHDELTFGVCTRRANVGRGQIGTFVSNAQPVLHSACVRSTDRPRLFLAR